jgi:hypothetical protein
MIHDVHFNKRIFLINGKSILKGIDVYHIHELVQRNENDEIYIPKEGETILLKDENFPFLGLATVKSIEGHDSIKNIMVILFTHY